MEKISALIDGELDDHEMERLLPLLKQGNDERESWEMFHLIGDTMRGDARMSADFSRRVAERLVLEPAILAPQRRDGNVVRYAMPIAASLAAISVVAWVAFSSNTLTAPGSPAAVNLAGPAPAQPASISSHGKMNEYLLAHQGFSPSTAIQGVVPYIRSVSVSPPPHNR